MTFLHQLQTSYRSLLVSREPILFKTRLKRHFLDRGSPPSSSLYLRSSSWHFAPQEASIYLFIYLLSPTHIDLHTDSLCILPPPGALQQFCYSSKQHYHLLIFTGTSTPFTKSLRVDLTSLEEVVTPPNPWLSKLLLYNQEQMFHKIQTIGKIIFISKPMWYISSSSLRSLENLTKAIGVYKE